MIDNPKHPYHRRYHRIVNRMAGTIIFLLLSGLSVEIVQSPLGWFLIPMAVGFALMGVAALFCVASILGFVLGRCIDYLEGY